MSPSTAPSRQRIRIGKLPFDPVTLEQALAEIAGLIRAREGGMVFTPNVDHVVIAESDPRFAAAYQASSLSLVDGTPVLWASHLLGTPLPAKISGSDLILPLMRRAAERNWRVYFLGGDAGTAELARQKLTLTYPNLKITGVDDARIDLQRVDHAVFERIRAARPDLVLVALGAPKQELFAKEYREFIKPAVALGVGAGLDFIAGTRKRAPAWISTLGLEWLFRLAQEPRRLAARYLLRDPRFFWIVLKQMFGFKARSKPALNEAKPPIVS